MRNFLTATLVTFTALVSAAQVPGNDLKRISARVNQEVQRSADFLDVQTQGRVVELLRAISRELKGNQNPLPENGQIVNLGAIGPISRMSGGAYASINIGGPQLQSLNLQLDGSRVRIYLISVLTQSGRQIEISASEIEQDLMLGSVLKVNLRTIQEPILRLDIRAEAWAPNMFVNVSGVLDNGGVNPLPPVSSTFTCSVQISNGLVYEGRGPSRLDAEFEAKKSCNAAGYTSSCSVPAKCERDSAPTSCLMKLSNGLVYLGSGASSVQAGAAAIKACNQAGYTTSCAAPVKCDVAGFTTRTCLLTISNGLSFRGSGNSLVEAEAKAIKSCNDSGYMSSCTSAQARCE